jgi:hypothetical protein
MGSVTPAGRAAFQRRDPRRTGLYSFESLPRELLPALERPFQANPAMAAFSRDLVHWTADAEPLYRTGGNPSRLDQQYAHKVSLVYNPKNATFYLYYCACGSKGRGIGLITSRPL